ncbi:putative tRNA ligase [Listeria phage vB_Lino_VEfB7]|nr:putative tRNA ligase [Listeria phage vB_Lino_VEfB7]
MVFSKKYNKRSVSRMIELLGRYNAAKVFTNEVEETAVGQVIELLSQEFIKGERVRFMPDIHAGKGCVVGTTMTYTNKVVPNLIGVDIGCGIRVTELDLEVNNTTLEKLDSVIKEFVPSGNSVRGVALNQEKVSKSLKNLTIYGNLKEEVKNRIALSEGTLGGGNHYIELGAYDGRIFLMTHTGSRNLGVQVAKTHQELAVKYCSNTEKPQELIRALKEQGREKDIQEELLRLKLSTAPFNKDLAYLDGKLVEDYLNDMAIAQKFAEDNRKAIHKVIMSKMGWENLVVSEFDSIHNYIDIPNKVIRKGATDASKGKQLVIPLNMRDGSIIATGKGNEDWNNSAPHGAGRVLSRSKAKETLEMEDFKNTMKDVWSSSVLESTLDEAPFAYKKKESILENITDTVDIDFIVKPIYNFKAH